MVQNLPWPEVSLKHRGLGGAARGTPACPASSLRGTSTPSPSTAHPGGPPWVWVSWNLALRGWGTLPCENPRLPLRFWKALALEPREE